MKHHPAPVSVIVRLPHGAETQSFSVARAFESLRSCAPWLLLSLSSRRRGPPTELLPKTSALPLKESSMTDHDEKAKRTPASEVPELPPKDLQAAESDQVVGGSITAKAHEMKKALIGNLPR